MIHEGGRQGGCMAVREGENVRVIARLLAGMFKTKHP